MPDSDAEIEFLDEDAEIVQHCVQNVSQPQEYGVVTPLLVERVPYEKRKRKRKNQEEDSDYIPLEEAPSPVPKIKKKKTPTVKKAVKSTATPTPVTPVSVPKKDNVTDVVNRKKMDIRIPDYDDPLCLPVRAYRRDENDVKRLRAWNNACLEHFKHCDNVLKPEHGVAKRSTRSIVLRNIVNKETGKYETAIWSKTTIENREGIKKSQIFQSILPKYREKKLLNSFQMQTMKRHKKFHHTDEVLLTNEQMKDGNSLVVYKPREALTAVYRLLQEKKGDKSDKPDGEEKRSYLQEIACCKTCAPCYQASWRGVRKDNKTRMCCPVCGRASPSAYNLLTHLRRHDAAHVRAHSQRVSDALAAVLDYHYTCRICQHKFTSIKTLRKHVAGHKGIEMFVCEIGNHMAS